MRPSSATAKQAQIRSAQEKMCIDCVNAKYHTAKHARRHKPHTVVLPYSRETMYAVMLQQNHPFLSLRSLEVLILVHAY